jgi:EmrB/QacA subfamily drug resistance transporter
MPDLIRRKASPMAVLAVVGFGVFVAADDLTVVSTMLRPIIGDLGIVLPDGLDDAAWIVNAYLIAYVAVMPFSGRLSDLFGRRRVYIAALSLFLVGSLIIPFTSSLGPFLFGRVLTAMGGGALVPIGLAVVGDAFAEDRRARSLGILGAIDTLGWVWGPLFGAMLIRFLSWQWQFYLNVPLAVIGIATAWWALAEYDRPVRTGRIDWVGAGALTVALVALNLALLGSAEIQSVTGLEELTGGSGESLRWLYPVALVAAIAFVLRERAVEEPLIDFDLFAGRNLTAAVIINFLVGAALVIAMVDVPLFVNVVEVDVERSAVIAGWVLSALTAAMAIMSYIGGRLTERWWYRPPVLIGLAMAAAAYLAMGIGWEVDTAYPLMAAQLAVLGAGFGLVIAPTTAAVVDGAPPDRRGTAASLVIVLRLIGLSVGLSGLTAWGLHRFNQFRDTVELPAISDPGYVAALEKAQAEVTTSALAETFVGAGVVTVVALLVALWMRRSPGGPDAAALPDPEAEEESPDETGDTAIAAFGTNDEGAPVNLMTQRRLAIGLGIVGVLVIGLGVLVAVLVGRVSTLESENAALRDDFARVESGAAIFGSQLTGFQQQLADLAPTVGGALDEAVAGLETFQTSSLDFEVPINEVIPIDVEIVLDRVIQVPVNTEIPISETFDTTITIAGPFGIDIPLDVSVPIDVVVPVNLDLEFPINETVPIQTEIAVDLTVPIAVDIAGTELAALAESLQQGLVGFKDVIEGLG